MNNLESAKIQKLNRRHHVSIRTDDDRDVEGFLPRETDHIRHYCRIDSLLDRASDLLRAMGTAFDRLVAVVTLWWIFRLSLIAIHLPLSRAWNN